ncbi:MAG: DUF29 domain-containing protein [Moorea sp. SIO1F2]|uniref:DUF29 domain-containing protein n=1 Tax=unclassified Moorena TaxID=2683338 RepID=UPI0013B69D52|nr:MULTISPECIES: DUF29 domain-containing protein [unclassified Moorena]NEN96794.1 DUF29 domain-containing protein [Moorena sp. SIO3I7]NEO64208.1 DUF29 domain-containing protein [Moorena sp. SIO4G2]NEO08654.1 DUF29 domain-containing protein [Moorena sp. SIO3I8]NEO23614.1 DUF29 domain-containing protein [Moorena sp. SIO4A5]NEP23030.1 DUF29 domain-containing protein [Moorena sp. SIO3I6]
MSNHDLYDQDFVLWTETTCQQLKTKNFDELDIDNLIEEIASLGRSDRRELQSRLKVLMEHLLKRQYVDSEPDYRGWENTIDEQREQINLLLSESPSLKPYLESVFSDCYRYPLKKVSRNYPSVSFPQNCPFTSDILDQD